MHSLTFVISWLLAALLGTVRQKGDVAVSVGLVFQILLLLCSHYSWHFFLLGHDLFWKIQSQIKVMLRLQFKGTYGTLGESKKSQIDISWNVTVEVHHLAERCRRLEGSSGEVQPQPRFYCSTCSRTLQLDYVIIIILKFFFAFSLIFDLTWLPTMTLVLCSFWSLRLFPIAGSIFEAGFGAVSGGAAQAATLEPSTSGELQVKCRFVCHEVQEVLWQLFQVACLESCFEC